MPLRIRLSRAKDFKLPADAVNVARPSRWGNPFVVGRDGSREECVRLYRMMLAGDLCRTATATIEEQEKVIAQVTANIDSLRGKDLACWCRLDGGPCHADLLLELANL